MTGTVPRCSWGRCHNLADYEVTAGTPGGANIPAALACIGHKKLVMERASRRAFAQPAVATSLSRAITEPWQQLTIDDALGALDDVDRA